MKTILASAELILLTFGLLLGFLFQAPRIL